MGKKPTDNAEKPLYIIDAYGNCAKLIDAKDAAYKTGISQHSILQCAEGEREYVKDVTFAFAEDIEDKTPSGIRPDSIIVNLASDVIKSCTSRKQLRNVVDILGSKNRDNTDPLENRPVFFMKPGQANSQASCNSSCGNQDIDSKDDNKQKTFRLNDIPDENLKNCERYSKSSFYIMDETHKYKKFFKQAHVASALGVDNRAINKCLKGKQHMLHGLALAYAYEIESVDENGNTVLNLEKLKRKYSKNDIYMVNRGGKCIKFNTPSEAAEKLDISKASLLYCLLGKQPVTSGYKIFRAKDLEIKKPDGSIAIDEAKINEAKLEITSRAVYLVNEKEQYTRYDTKADAARAIGVSHGSISACLNGKRKTIKGYIVMPANEVEKINKDGSYTIRFDKIRETLKASKESAEPIDIRENGFYAINRDMECKKFYSIKSTENVLKVNLSAITACLKGITESAGGYVYFRAEDIEIKDKDGTIKLDKAKIAEKLSVFDGHPFYSIDNKGNCRRFNN